MWEIYSKLTIKTLERGHLLLTCSGVSHVDFEQVNAGWEERWWQML